MIKLLLEKIKKFLKDEEPPFSFLLGLSGGVDSLTLFHLLLECSKDFLFTFDVAHFDHGWREESALEAIWLKSYVEKFGITCFTEKGVSSKEGNKEERAREERLAFFSHLYNKNGYNALILGHQGDEQGETVLKRILEGAHFSTFSAMGSSTYIRGMRVWRPLIDVEKKKIINWANGLELPFIDDRTNRDPAFLRARMRVAILPNLSKTFGKEVGKNLLHLGRSVEKLNLYLEKKSAPFFASIEEGPFGIMVDFSKHTFLEEIEVEFFLRKLFAKKGFAFSRGVIESITKKMIEGNVPGNRANRFLAKKGVVILDRKRVFILDEEIPTFLFKEELCSQKVRSGSFECILSCSFSNREVACTSWRDLFKGKGEMAIPKELVKNSTLLSFPFPFSGKRSMKRKWTSDKVPLFFTRCAPCVVKEGRAIAQFLSRNSPLEGEKLLISLEIKRIQL